mmetsp:Transcript_64843/g.125102  ORF Transcript_64843/g.125102 Transcript_64843/m.125102 type:complete len:540 (-) Transcript_64843:38-1657(-)
MLQYPSGYPMPERFPVLRHVLSTRKDHKQLTRQKTRKVAPIGYIHKKVRQRDAFGGTVRMLILALDYKGSGHDLTCTVDGDNMQALARASGVQDLTVAYNEQCTPANVRELVQAIGARCQPNDTFIFNFSGHGTSVTDTDGDEEDHQDEAYVLVDETGQINTDTALMTDDEFSEILVASIPKTTKILVISDCCHSGTIVDFAKPFWRGRKAISISGCRDAQTSGDTGNGGICTHAILLAVDSLQSRGETRYSVAKLFNETLRKDDEVFDSAQDITIDSSVGVRQTDIDWPLVPKSPYTAPHSQPVGAGYQDGPAPANTYTLQLNTDGPAPASTYTLQSSVDVPATANSHTLQSSVVPTAATATYTTTSPVVAPGGIFVTPNIVPGMQGSSFVGPVGTSGGAHVTHSIPGNSYYMPSVTHSSACIAQASSPYVVQQHAVHPVPTNHYVVQASGVQQTTHLTVPQPVPSSCYPGPCATQFANPGHTAFFTSTASHGVHPQVVTNFAPLGSGHTMVGSASQMTYSAGPTGVSIEEPAAHVSY